MTTLGPDTEFEGTLKFRHTLKIEGKFKGSITTDGHVIVGRTGEVNAEMRAGSLVIEGKMNGNVTADSLIDLRSSAEVHGNITASKLKMEEGVVFVGETSIMPKERRAAAK
ncbi:MAG: polymer-forming cytoskeletal protein [bacterium]